MKMILNQESVGLITGVGTVSIYTDDETGVEYFVSNAGHGGHNICPRYNADGTLMINTEYLESKGL